MTDLLHQVMTVCETIADFGGRQFKKELVKSLIGSEGKELMEELVYEYLSPEQAEDGESDDLTEIDDCSHDEDTVDTRQNSTFDEYISCDESLLDE